MKETRSETTATGKPKGRSDFVDALKNGLLIGAVISALLLPPISIGARIQHRLHPNVPATQANSAAMAPKAPPTAQRLADFGAARPTGDVKKLANWAVASADHGNKAFVIVDKKDAHVWVFNPDGRLQADAPALMGAAIGDDSAPGIGDKPIAQILPEEKTTPAGRFVAEMGMDTRNEDVVWVSYDLAVSMHRLLTTPEGLAERRPERLASPTPEDNRISYGCINLPKAFYENVLAPTVRARGAIVYVLPETRDMQTVFKMRANSPVQVAQDEAKDRSPRAGVGNE